MLSKKSIFSLTVTSVLLVAGCDPNKMANRFFKDLGLNRLAVPKTGILPGAVILSDSTQTMYAGNISKYLKPEDMPTAGAGKDSVDAFTQSFKAVLPSYSGKQGLDASSTLKFISKVLPGLSGSLKLNGTVDLDQISADVQRIDPEDLEAIFNDSQKSAALAKKLQERWDGNSDIYIAYEVYLAKSFNLKTTSDLNIAPDINVGQSKVVTSGDAKFTITHGDTRTLKIDSDTPYVIALKTAKVEPRGGSWRLRIMKQAHNIGAGTKGANDQYSALISAVGAAIEMKDRPNGLD